MKGYWYLKVDEVFLKKLLVLNKNVSVDFMGKNIIKDIFEIIVNYNIVL